MAKILMLITLALTGTCFAQVSPGSSASAGYTIDLAGPTGKLTVASPLIITVTVKNVSGKDIWWRADFGDTEYKAFKFLLKKDGREIETTFFHRKMTGRQRPEDPNEVTGGQSIVSPIAPGKSLNYTIDLRRLYQINQAGDYSLTVSRHDEGSDTTVSSIPLLFTIEP